MRTWEAELATLVAERGRALIGYAHALTGDLGRAEDLVQDALVKTFARSRRMLPGTPSDTHLVPLHDDGAGTPVVSGTEAYVRRAILTLFLDDHRRRRRWTERLHLVAQTGHVRAPEHAATAHADVTSALALLDHRQRAAVVLRHYEDLTVPQIARAMNVAEGTVKRYLSDATATLRDVLGERPAAPTPTTFPTAPTKEPVR